MSSKFLKISFLFLSLFFSISTLNAQVPKIIDSENLSPQLVTQIFDQAFMNINKEKTKGNYVVVKEGAWNVYMSVSNKKYITYSLSFNFVDTATEREKLELINLLNTQVLMIAPRYSSEKNNIWIKYDYYIEAGVTPKSIVSALKKFKSCVDLTLKKDTAKIIK